MEPWLREIPRKFDGLDSFCPYNEKTGMVLVGLTLLTDNPPGKVIGTFEFVDGAIRVILDDGDRSRRGHEQEKMKVK